MDYHSAMLAIQQELDGEEWTSITLSRVASILVSAGYRVRDLNEVDHPTGAEAWS